MIRVLLPALVLAVALSACANSGRDSYTESEVGQSTAVSFGSVLAVREVDIEGEASGVGSIVGGAAGAGAGTAIGSGSGTGWAMLGGAIAGAIVGGVLEAEAKDRKGLEYTVILESGVVLTVVQEIPEDDVMPQVGDRVIVQNSGGYQRVLAADSLPTQVEQPQGIEFVEND